MHASHNALVLSALLVLGACGGREGSSDSGSADGGGTGTVSITSPTSPAIVTDPSVVIQVFVEGAAERVDLTLDGAPLVMLVPPYTYEWNVDDIFHFGVDPSGTSGQLIGPTAGINTAQAFGVSNVFRAACSVVRVTGLTTHQLVTMPDARPDEQCTFALDPTTGQLHGVAIGTGTPYTARLGTQDGASPWQLVGEDTPFASFTGAALHRDTTGRRRLLANGALSGGGDAGLIELVVNTFEPAAAP